MIFPCLDVMFCTSQQVFSFSFVVVSLGLHLADVTDEQCTVPSGMVCYYCIFSIVKEQNCMSFVFLSLHSAAPASIPVCCTSRLNLCSSRSYFTPHLCFWALMWPLCGGLEQWTGWTLRDPDLSTHSERAWEGGRETDTPRYSTLHRRFLQPDSHVIRCACVYRAFRLGNSWGCTPMVTEGARYWRYYV